MKPPVMSTKKLIFSYLLLFIALTVVFFISLLLGAEKINIKDAFSGQGFSFIILTKLRLPRSLLALLSGVLLAGAGAVFQMFFRNPLAEPGIMGISSGATLGAVTASVLGLSPSFALISPVNLFAFFGAILSGIIVTLIATGKSGKEASVMLLLCGTALGTLYSSISSILLLTNAKEIHTIYSWTLGSFNGHGWKELIFILIPAAVSLILMFYLAPSLDLLTGGEDSAESLGLNVQTVRIFVLVCGALATSAAVCAGGTISFIGLIAPHIVRKIIGPKAKNLIPISILFGAILLLLADTLARVLIAPSELPAGIITSILGVPFFISICFSFRK